MIVLKKGPIALKARLQACGSIKFLCFTLRKQYQNFSWRNSSDAASDGKKNSPRAYPDFMEHMKELQDVSHAEGAVPGSIRQRMMITIEAFSKEARPYNNGRQPEEHAEGSILEAILLRKY